MRSLRASPWLIPLIGLYALGFATPDLVHMLGFGSAVVAVVLVGGPLGWLWYHFSPRPLVQRLRPFVYVVIGLLLFRLVGGQVTVDVPGVYSVLGVVAGLAIGERLPARRSAVLDKQLSSDVR